MNLRSSGARRALGVALFLGVAGAIAATSAIGGSEAKRDNDTPAARAALTPLAKGENDQEGRRVLLERDAYFTSLRTAGDNQLAPEQAGRYRAIAAGKALQQRKGPKSPGTKLPNPAWSQLGPNPIVQQVRTSGGLAAMSGRIGDLLILDDGTRLLGGAQGGIWMWNGSTGTWEPKSDDSPSLAIGALAAAPSNNDIVYAGTGEGALSGDSMYGNGVLKSTDGGNTWNHVSGDFFEGVSISRIVVNPTDPNNLYASVLRGRGGARRVTPAEHSRYGIWHSTDGGVNWTLLKEVSESNGATDLEMDPQNPSTLWASFWSDTLYKSTDGGNTWNPVDFGLPSPDFAAAASRVSVTVSHPIGVTDPVLYAGFEWVDSGGYHPARIFKSVDGGTTWTMTPSGNSATTDHSEDYCGTQCFYDNVVQASPVNPDIVFIGGNFNYGAGSGGVYKTIDGGTHWLDMGYDQHPDFHATAFNPDDATQVLIGNDGGVWFSPDLGGRSSESEPLSNADWENLNGTVDPGTGGALARTGLAIAQYTSIAPAVGVPAGASSERYWGGTQDNGTLRKSVNSNSWFDEAGGDGGQVLVDPTEAGQPCDVAGSSACHVYGEYFGISPYRFSDGGALLFDNFFITNGLNLNDRSEFYVPMWLNENNTDQLFLGTFRLYRTDNARAVDPADVKWNPISNDLTGGCTGTAPNGARTCAISAIGTGGGTAVYVGTLDGRVWMATDGQTSMTPNWVRQDSAEGSKLPNRPVSWFAVDRSNYRNAWIAYNGFNAATPKRPGHVFRTTDAGKHWKSASGNLPDVPVNSLDQDPSFPLTLYAATDVGPYVTEDGGKTWSPLGTGFPLVTVWQLKMDTSRRILAAGTHGRGAFRAALGDSVPSLVLAKFDDGTPVGGGSHLTYTLTVRNIGNADATGVTITDPVPVNTKFVSADNGGSQANKNAPVKWTGLSVPAGGSVTVHFTVMLVSKTGKKKYKSVTNDGVTVTSAQGPGATGSPIVTNLAPPYGVELTPETQRDGAHTGDSVDYIVHVRNSGFTPSAYTMSSTGGTFPVSIMNAACSSPLTTTSTVNPGASTDVCVRVSVPGGANENDASTSTIKAAAVPSPAADDTATITTLAVSKDWLLVDDDDNDPDVASYYTAALAGAGVSNYGTWDILADPALPPGYLAAHKYVVWFTGNSYPAPITKYEDGLQMLLDGGGHLFMSGQDILDQGAGTTDFVHDYLHITWDGTETQNDKATATVTGVTGDPIGNGLGTKPLDHSVLGASFEDRITPNGTASPAFQDDTAQTDGLSYTDGTGYQVVFLAFPFEAYGNAADKTTLMGRVVTFFTT